MVIRLILAHRVPSRLAARSSSPTLGSLGPPAHHENDTVRGAAEGQGLGRVLHAKMTSDQECRVGNSTPSQPPAALDAVVHLGWGVAFADGTTVQKRRARSKVAQRFHIFLSTCRSWNPAAVVGLIFGESLFNKVKLDIFPIAGDAVSSSVAIWSIIHNISRHQGA